MWKSAKMFTLRFNCLMVFDGVECWSCSDVDREMKRYNIDEFYGIELEEQHIKAPSADDKFSHLPFELKSKYITVLTTFSDFQIVIHTCYV